MKTMIQWQMYWPSWWRLWPWYGCLSNNTTKTCHKFFGFGPFQMRWRETVTGGERCPGKAADAFTLKLPR